DRPRLPGASVAVRDAPGARRTRLSGDRGRRVRRRVDVHHPRFGPDRPAAASPRARLVISGREALARLQEGNRGFVAGLRDATASPGQNRRPALPLSQGPRQSPKLRSIVDRIRPAVEPLLEALPSQDLEALVAHAVRANIRAAADHLRHGSELLERLVKSDGLLIVGAEYCLETGVVEFFDGMPEARPGPRSAIP